jgi:hypothetical protein
MDDITYVGLDVHKATVCVALAKGEREQAAGEKATSCHAALRPEAPAARKAPVSPKTRASCLPRRAVFPRGR